MKKVNKTSGQMETKRRENEGKLKKREGRKYNQKKETAITAKI